MPAFSVDFMLYPRSIANSQEVSENPFYGSAR